MVSKSWCFTINGAEPFQYLENEMQYLVYQKESGHEEKTEHYQGYVRFNKNKRLTGCKKIHSTAHWEIARGTPLQNKNYCTKEDTRIDGPWEFGDIPKQGKRNDLEQVAETIRNAKRPISEVIEEHPVHFIKYTKGIKELCNYHLEKKTRTEFRTVNVTVHWGSTGTGKTRNAVEFCDDFYVLRNEDKIWFDGYTGQRCLIIDEFKNWIPITTLLGYLDGYQCRLPIKGSFTYAQWDTVFITSNLPIEEWYPNVDDEHKNALRRRINKIVHFNSPL